MVRGHGLDSSGSEQGEVAGSSQCDYEIRGYNKRAGNLTR